MIAPVRLYLTDDERVVAEGHPEAAWLLIGEGMEIPADLVEKYALETEPWKANMAALAGDVAVTPKKTSGRKKAQ